MKMNVNIDMRPVDVGPAHSGSAWGLFITTITEREE
jgi:hypothetical protein